MDDDPTDTPEQRAQRELERTLRLMPWLERKPYRRGTYEAARVKRDWKRRAR